MEYRRFGNDIAVRLDRGEEVLDRLKKVCLAEGVKVASVSAIGATDDFTVGVLDVKAHKYLSNNYNGNHEIVSLCGNVTTKDGEFYAHLHMSASDKDGKTVGGHLNRAVISATCEMFVRVIDAKIERKFDEEVGLNLFKFE